MVVWSRLIRFISTDGRLLRGEPILPDLNFDIGTTTEETKLQARVIHGDDIYDLTGATKVTDEIVTVRKLLGPLTKDDVPIIRCVGLNYMKHSMSLYSNAYLLSVPIDQPMVKKLTQVWDLVREAGRKPPPFPFIFFKPTTCIEGHNAEITIPKIAQDNQADYEGELVRP